MTRQSETLARFALFRSLGKDLIQRLDSQCTWRRARADEWLVEYEDDSVDLYFVAYGRLRVTIRLISGTEIILRDLDEGEFFGELAALDGRSRSAGVVAMTDSVIARMAPSVFRAVVHEHAAVCDQLLALLAAQVRTLAARVTELARSTCAIESIPNCFGFRALKRTKERPRSRRRRPTRSSPRA